MGTYTFDQVVRASPEALYRLWTDPTRMPEWIEGVSRITDVTGEPGKTGSRYTVWFGRMASPTEVIEADPPRRIRTRFGNRLLRGHTEVRLEPDGEATRLTQTFTTEGLLPAIMARIFATGSYQGSFRGELARFAPIAEQEAHPEAP